LGPAMPLTILFILAQQSFGAVANSEVVAVEIVRSLVGTIGIVAAVPLTTWMATMWPSAHRHQH
ncbi:MAG: YibE/F family protein, partial [Actinomycetia bacterium]|nr:YibE/F family protein [Actinomycetes bacterium]